MNERGLRERVLYYALVPAIVVAVLVLGGLALRTTLQLERARQQTVLDATATLATERATLLDNHIVAQDNVVAAHTNLSDLTQLGKKWMPTAARETPSVRAIIVLDLSHASREVVAFASKAPSPEDDTFRRLLLTRLFRTLNMEGQTEELRHLHEVIDDRQYLLSYWQRTLGGRRYIVVVWHDVERIVHEIMPQLYRDPDRGNARMNVVDERGRIIFGPPIKVGDFGVTTPFPTTLYNWRLQVALTSAEEVGRQVERRRFIELSLVVVAALVTILGLIIIIGASAKERRVAALKSEFVANVSHELKTPLSLIRMFGELLLMNRAQTEDKRKQYLSIIVGESERLTALIENVLDFARVERGNVAYDFTEGDLAAVARRAVEVYRFRAEREGVTLTLDAPKTEVVARLDPRAMELAAMNLVDNALKYAKDGGHVTVRVTEKGGRAELSVSDLGPGVPKLEQARIFERFFRGAAAGTTRARGSGIGLSLVKHITDAHGGTASVESPTEPNGGGTRFTLSLPRAAHETAQSPASGPDAGAHSLPDAPGSPASPTEEGA
ncbi:MAG TPA: HAMP domain-containing sensor histidine kinase [Polyangiaceae bacterium]|nr:HAMP domain-containing sensor histidine kinase [Polyangiaceae bacterium]